MKTGEKKKHELLNYDKKRHFELLDQSSGEFNSDLLHYSSILSIHLHWEIRDQYIKLLENYRKGKIDNGYFSVKFSERYHSIDEVVDLLESNRVLLSPDKNKNSVDFESLISDIDICCELYSADPEPIRSEFEIGDVEFQASVEKLYLKIQKLLKQE